MSNKSFLAKITGIAGVKNDGKKEETESEKKPDQIIDKTEDKHTEKAHSKKPDPVNWVEQNYEGQLSVDVYQTKDDIVIKSAVAGVEPKDLDISINNDMITIRGSRKQDEEIAPENYFYQECYWGPFSRSIILPQEVKTEAVQANFKKGILTIRLPKTQSLKKITVQINDNC